MIVIILLTNSLILKLRRPNNVICINKNISTRLIRHPLNTYIPRVQSKFKSLSQTNCWSYCYVISCKITWRRDLFLVQIVFRLETFCFIFKIKCGYFWREKEEIWLSPMTEALTPTEKSKKQRDNTKNATKNFDCTTIADRLRTVSWGNDSHPAGVVKPVYGIPTFPLTAKAM